VLFREDSFVVRSEYLLELLNEETKVPPFSALRSMSEPSTRGYSGETSGPVDPDLEAEANNHFVATLRSLIDQWLESGRSGIAEAPKKRKLVRGEGAGEPWYVLHDWIAKHRILPILTESGEAVIALPSRWDSNSDPVGDAKNEGILYFFKMLQSTLRYRIAKCTKPYCGRYFCYERVPKDILECGALCPNHRSHGATIRKDRQRKLRKQGLLRFAANAWPRSLLKFPDDHAARYRWVADQTNKRLGPHDQRITKRFITQNDEVIESMAEKNYAKS
jgi:hypothetical protein